jgi:acyl carrier protein
MSDAHPVSPVTDDAILAFLRRIAREDLELTTHQAENIRLDTPLVEGLALDSLRQVVLLSMIEDEFRFELDLAARERLEQIQTVGELVQTIRAKLSS